MAKISVPENYQVDYSRGEAGEEELAQPITKEEPIDRKGSANQYAYDFHRDRMYNEIVGDKGILNNGTVDLSSIFNTDTTATDTTFSQGTDATDLTDGTYGGGGYGNYTSNNTSNWYDNVDYSGNEYVPWYEKDGWSIDQGYVPWNQGMDNNWQDDGFKQWNDGMEDNITNQTNWNPTQTNVFGSENYQEHVPWNQGLEDNITNQNSWNSGLESNMNNYIVPDNSAHTLGPEGYAGISTWQDVIDNQNKITNLTPNTTVTNPAVSTGTWNPVQTNIIGSDNYQDYIPWYENQTLQPWQTQDMSGNTSGGGE